MHGKGDSGTNWLFIISAALPCFLADLPLANGVRLASLSLQRVLLLGIFWMVVGCLAAVGRMAPDMPVIRLVSFRPFIRDRNAIEQGASHGLSRTVDKIPWCVCPFPQGPAELA